MKYIDSEKLIAEIEMRIAQWQPYTFACASQIASEAFDRIDELKGLLIFITSLQQEQPDFDDVDPKHLVHSHYTKVRETKTGRVFWAEYSSEAAEWYEAGTGNTYSISDVEIVQEQPEVDLEKEWKSYMESRKDDLSGNAVTVNMKDLARYFYELARQKYEK